jgi:hypothetical protein
MSDRRFNPSRFADLVDEDCYATGWGPGARLKRDRQEAGESAPQEGQRQAGGHPAGEQTRRLQAAGPVQVSGLPAVQPRGAAADHPGHAAFLKSSRAPARSAA